MNKNIKRFIKNNKFNKNDYFDMKNRYNLKDIYTKDLFIVKGDNSDDLGFINLIIKQDDSMYLVYPSSLGYILLDDLSNNDILKIIDATKILGSYLDINTNFINDYSSCYAIDIKIDDNINDKILLDFIRDISIFQCLVELAFNTDTTNFLDDLLKEDY